MSRRSETMTQSQPEFLWEPPAHVRESTIIGQYLLSLEEHLGRSIRDYDELHAWSVQNLSTFWSSFAQFVRVRFHAEPTEVLSSEAMPGARWFRGAMLNYAEHCLRGPDDELVLVGLSETRDEVRLTR